MHLQWIYDKLFRCRGDENTDPDSKIDLYIRTDAEETLFEIKTAKPNIDIFTTMKLKLLRWTALRLSQDRDANISTRIGIPYNPYEPQPYERWTLKGLFDLEYGEVLVGDEFWNFVANDDIYEELLLVFQNAGDELRPEIDAKYARFRTD